MTRDDRRQTLRQALSEGHLDVLVCTAPSDVLLLTGFWPIMGDTVALFTSEGATHLIVPEDEHNLATSMSDVSCTTYTPETLSELTGPIEQLRDPLRTLLSQLTSPSATLGLRRSYTLQPAAYLTASDFHQALAALLTDLLPSAHLQSADLILEQLKSTKTPEELNTLRLAGRLAGEAFAAVPALLQPGLREAEVASRLQTLFDASPTAAQFHRSYGTFFCMSGPHSATAAAAFARTRQRTLTQGDLVMIHANTCADGLWTDITRTYTVGEPAPRHQEMRHAILEARGAALAAIRPGTPAHEVDRAARQVMEAHGFGKAFKHATGHGVGFAAAFANALPRIHPRSPDVLADTMTFNVEPAAYFDGYGGMRHCDVVAVTPTGHEVLTDF